MSRSRVSCGIDFDKCTDLSASIDHGCKSGFDFICVPIAHPRFKKTNKNEADKTTKPELFAKSDLLLTTQEWCSLVVAKTSTWIDTESTDETKRKDSETALKQELSYASHLSVPAIMLPLYKSECANMVRILNQHITAGHNHQFWIRVPMKSVKEDKQQMNDVVNGEAQVNGNVDEQEQSMEQELNIDDTWHWWNTVRIMCDGHKRLGVALEMSADLPSPDVIDRWCGEPIKSCLVPTNIFLTNKKGFPVLTRAHQSFIRRCYKLEAQVIITGEALHPERSMKAYQQYMEHLWQTMDPPDQVSVFAKGYEDYLQCPLQPLKDNLESQTYEVFEKDPVKYSQYQKAVYHALLDKIPEAEKETKELILMVVGAGRGPLVTASLNAAKSAERKLKVYAVEKNPNAVIILETLKEEVWKEQVTVVSCDMRFWDAPVKADILVSELLGSLGDNELSPECLDGAQKFLKEDGISIPSEYTSYIAPLASQKLWNEARLCKEQFKHPDASFETPYVVRLHNVNVLDSPQPLFTFKHPNWNAVIDNNRYGVKEFNMPIDTLVHGFSGYFDCVLYKDVMLSIVPDTHSPGMFSWFPLFFPIKEPMVVNNGDKLKVHFWRLADSRNVWYEWCITHPKATTLHNPRGRSYTIDL